MKKHNYDVIVVGAGHAGLEAAFIAAKFNLKVALFNLNLQSIANLPCNPSVGGAAKGVLLREIDALGGIQGIASDENKIQIKKINYSKGPGVWAYRAQLDKEEYHSWFIKQIKKNKNIELILGEITNLIKKNNEIIGVKTKESNFLSKAIIITAGTYLKSEIHNDKITALSGPDDNPRSNYLSDFFRTNNIKLLRLKTGTSPRVYKDSIDFSKMTKDLENNDKISFSFQKPKTLALKKQMDCFLTESTEKTKKFIKKHKKNFGIYNGSVVGVGPRYCPSIEDKIIRFPDRKKHFIFVEPVGRKLDYYYLSGLSTSLKQELQLELLKTITGFENAKIKRFAYSIVYDAINPIQLKKTLELKKIKNLYFAGQVNGTSGYEEAAAQGLMAGINASLKILNKKPLILQRNEAYIGVLIDDLTSKGVEDPYRLLTSRAEFRLLLRNDNADERLMKYSNKHKLISQTVYKQHIESMFKIHKNIKFLKTNFASSFNFVDGSQGPLTLFSWVCRDFKNYELIEKKLSEKLEKLTDDLKEKMLIYVKYEGYIEIQNKKLKKLEKWKKIKLLAIKNYSSIVNLCKEAIEKLNKKRPITMDDALKIPGININDVFWIKSHLESSNKKQLKI